MLSEVANAHAGLVGIIQVSAYCRLCRYRHKRHSFASFGVGLGLPLQQVGKLLGHSQIATTERYAHLADDPIRRANERIGDHIWSVMSGQPKAEVVEISESANVRR